ncbi:MAG: prepilin-type N-terminal cleavage/methylation domain-containing protein [Luteolibacter sp.]
MKNPIKTENPRSDARIRSGFTLIEVLTVIAIISILMTAGAIGLGNISAGKGTSSGIATCESLFDEARVIAVSKRCKARVMVKVDDPADTDYLQRVVVVHEEIDSTGNPVANSWVLSSRGYIMPKGVFFSQKYSKDANGNALDTFTLTGSKTDFNGEYIYYEFNAEGISSDPGASFVIAAGARGKGQEPKTTSGERDFAGFVIWRNGRTSTYRNPGQIPGVDAHPVNTTF